MRAGLLFIVLLAACAWAPGSNDAGNGAEGDAGNVAQRDAGRDGSRDEPLAECASFGESDCPEERCNALRARPASDVEEGEGGELVFITCVQEEGCGDGDVETCASNEDGEMFIFTTNCIPPSWMPDCDSTP
jgi:hypothetical protein